MASVAASGGTGPGHLRQVPALFLTLVIILGQACEPGAIYKGALNSRVYVARPQMNEPRIDLTPRMRRTGLFSSPSLSRPNRTISMFNMH